jgi:hypothetical protein
LGRADVLTTLLEERRVPTRHRAVLAALCGLLAAAVTIQKNVREPTHRDFEQVWFAARAILSGVNPYTQIGPGLAFDWPFPLVYPLPAAVIAIPFAPLTATMATAFFSALAGAVFAWALMEYGYGPLFGFFSMPVRAAFETVQWSPLLAASTVLTPLAIISIAKPTVGSAVFFARPNRWAVAGAIVFGSATLLIDPRWVAHWLGAIAQYRAILAPTVPFRAPITFIGGPVALLCLLRWRRPEARLVAALACVPQTLVLYEAVPLLLVPRTFWQSVAVVALSYIGHLWVRLHLPANYHDDLAYHLVGQAMVWSLYLPCTLLVLRRKNVGELPAWLERRIAGWPAWLRGQSGERP